jgi:uncharacterized protein (DUF302 family)
MSEEPGRAQPPEGVVSTRSPFPVGDTVRRLSDLIAAAGARLFLVIDQSGEAERAGLSLRDTKLLIFGSPGAGTPIMAADPFATIDLPLKIVVWEDDDGTVWMTYLDPGWLAARHGLTGPLVTPLTAPARMAAEVAAS